MAEPLSVPNGELRLVDDVEVAFADLVAAELGSAVAEGRATQRAPFRLVLSGGSTAKACYTELATRSGLPWERVECLVGDERCVPPDDPAANQAMIRAALIDRVTPTPAFQPMDCAQPPAAYAEVLVEAGHLDLVHLGLGPDGHTASLFPGSAALEAPPGRLVDRNTDPSGRNPHERLTLTLAGIGLARLVVFTVAGPEKHEALAHALAHHDLPATRVRADRVVWLCDASAALGAGLGRVGA